MSDKTLGPLRPPTDTRPLTEDELIPEEWKLLERIADEFDAIRNEVQQHLAIQRARPAVSPFDEPWSMPDERRTPRILLLDGPRGSGKSSFTLTLHAAWRGRMSGDSSTLQRLRDQGRGLRLLRPLDFDPQPDHVHPYAWIVLALYPVVEFVERHRPAPRRNCRDEREPDLRRRWDLLYQAAVLGWDGALAREQVRGDIDQFVYEQSEGGHGWLQLQHRWEEFVSHLLALLGDIDRLAEDGLLVVTIDDLDLHPGQVKHLLLALRLMRHPRVVFFLNGDGERLLNVLQHELLDAARHNAITTPRDMVALTRQREEQLARDLLRKVIPPRFRLPMPRLEFLDAVQRAGEGRPPREWLSGLFGDDPGMASWVDRIIDLVPTPQDGTAPRGRHPQEWVRFRDFVAVLDASPATRITRLLDLLDVTVTDSGQGGTGPVPVRELAAAGPIGVQQDEASMVDDYVQASSLGFYVRPEKGGPLRRLGPAALMALDLERLGSTRIEPINSPIVWSRFSATGYALEVPWPARPVRSPAEARSRLRRWLSFDAKHREHDDRIACWIQLLLEEETGRSTELPKPTESLDWIALLASIPAPGSARYGWWPVGPWALLALIATLAAPEYGLSPARQLDLLERLRDLLGDDWDAASIEAEATRVEMLRHAVDRFSRSESAEELKVARVDGEIRKRWPAAVWYSRQALAPLNDKWWTWPLDERGTRPDFLTAPQLRPRGDGREHPTPLKLLFSDVQDRPNWAAMAISDALRRDGLLRSWQRILAAVQDRYGGTAASAAGLVSLWQHASDLRRAPKLSEWFRVRKDARSVEYVGPEVHVEFAVGSDASVTWQVMLGRRELLDPVLSGLLVILQSFAATESGQRPASIEIARAHEIPFAPPEIPAWVDWDLALRRWRGVLLRASALNDPRQDLGAAIERWRDACWFSICRDAWTMNRTQLPDIVPHTFPADLLDAWPHVPDGLRAWASGPEILSRLSPEERERWISNLQVPSPPRQPVNIKGVPFQPDEVDSALDLLNTMPDPELRALLGQPAGKYLKRRPILNDRDLDVPGVGPATLRRLRDHVAKPRRA